MCTTIYALVLRAAAGLALGLALFLWVLPLSLYSEGIWLQGAVDLLCFLAISGLLSAPLGIAAASSWRRSSELWSGNQRKRPQPAAGALSRERLD